MGERTIKVLTCDDCDQDIDKGFRFPNGTMLFRGGKEVEAVYVDYPERARDTPKPWIDVCHKCGLKRLGITESS